MLKVIPDDAKLALSCGNPLALANLKDGKAALDLGSDAGSDCFLAGTNLGLNGKFIKMDMMPEMVEKARMNAKKNSVENVELGLERVHIFLKKCVELSPVVLWSLR